MHTKHLFIIPCLFMPNLFITSKLDKNNTPWLLLPDTKILNIHSLTIHLSIVTFACYHNHISDMRYVKYFKITTFFKYAYPLSYKLKLYLSSIKTCSFLFDTTLFLLIFPISTFYPLYSLIWIHNKQILQYPFLVK